ncbi:hypothetical protein AB4Z54_15315, partial [Streptomyces sp. MCAF7]
MSPDERDEFDRISAALRAEPEQVEIIDPTPYGGTTPAKTGLTPRGKVVMGLAGAVIVGSTIVGYTAYSADSDSADTRAAEIQLQRERLELDKLKEQNKAAADQRKANQ